MLNATFSTISRRPGCPVEPRPSAEKLANLNCSFERFMITVYEIHIPLSIRGQNSQCFGIEMIVLILNALNQAKIN